jgi:uncharacterized protein
MRAPDLALHADDDADVDGLDELETFLSSARVAPDCMRISALDGLLAALVLSPQPIAPEAWLSRIWGGQDPRFENARQMRRIIHLMRARHDQIQRQLQEEPGSYRPVFRTTDDGTEIAAEWADGFLAGMSLCPEAWEPLVRGEVSQSLVAVIFAQRPEYDGMWSPEAHETLAGWRRQAPETIPRVVAAIASFWRERWEMDDARPRRPGSSRLGGSGRQQRRRCGAT